MKQRIEVDTEGYLVLRIPEELVEDYHLEEGDVVEWDDYDSESAIVTFA